MFFEFNPVSFLMLGPEGRKLFSMMTKGVGSYGVFGFEGVEEVGGCEKAWDGV
ncbi:hypothetical protein ACFPFU_25440 [Negadavirga shengliensis]|uniref:Uncharacterized protein n=1 Tax=Negadavirga shengliensis TaxID=1389218 RepID=A0ABV9T8E3_9BACT